MTYRGALHATKKKKKDDRHCEKDGMSQPRDFGELGESYPPEIRCWENAHSRLVPMVIFSWDKIVKEGKNNHTRAISDTDLATSGKI